MPSQNEISHFELEPSFDSNIEKDKNLEREASLEGAAARLDAIRENLIETYGVSENDPQSKILLDIEVSDYVRDASEHSDQSITEGAVDTGFLEILSDENAVHTAHQLDSLPVGVLGESLRKIESELGPGSVETAVTMIESSGKSYEKPGWNQLYETNSGSEVVNKSSFEDDWAQQSEILKSMLPKYGETESSQIDVAPVDEVLTTAEINERLEKNNVVKQAPNFADQASDQTRDNIITYVSSELALNGSSNQEFYHRRRGSMTETEALASLHSFLEDMSQDEDILKENRFTAKSMLENMTFIGEKEYKEASAAIAESWKYSLDSNPDLQICAVSDSISSSTGRIKSDQYLSDTILSNFSDEELEKYSGRLVSHEEEITSENPDNVKVVLLDDWTISGGQMSQAIESFTSRNPHLGQSVEVQLIAADSGRIESGFTTFDRYGERTSIPTKAYYLAKDSEEAAYGAHITGSHSSVDYDFENDISEMIKDKNREIDLANLDSPGNDETEHVTMPPMTNIVRPYREFDATLDNQARLDKANNYSEDVAREYDKKREQLIRESEEDRLLKSLGNF